MSEDWKQFQDLVARIERIASPRDAVVKSPDQLPDLATGGTREVDASIRFAVGTVDVLITIECRRRHTVQHAPWIEQLATKRESIGASTTIAVSASGFGKPARELAKRKGIILRQIAEVSDNDIENLLTPVYRMSPHVEITEWGVERRIGRSSRPIELAPDLLRRIESEGTEADIFVHVPSANELSLIDLIRMHRDERGMEAFDDVPTGGGKVEKMFNFVFPDPDTLTLRTRAEGVIDLAKVGLVTHLSVSRTLVPPHLAAHYYAPDGMPSLTHVEHELPDQDGTLRLTIQHSEDNLKPRFAVELTDTTGEFRPAKLEWIRRVARREQSD